MPARDSSLTAVAAREGGAVAMRYWKADPQVWEKPGQGPVTEADLAVNALLADRLRSARPSYGWLSEESTDTADRLDCEHVFIIDPIDGTRAFIAGESHFAISIAIARNREIIAGAIYLPALDRLYTADDTGPARMNGASITASSRAELAGANMLMSKGFAAPENWRDPPSDLKRSFRSSIAYRLCLVAEGSFDGMVSTRDAWEWDIAAGSLIARQAGANVTDRLGNALQFNSAPAKTPGIFAAVQGVHRGILAGLKS